MKLMRAGKKLTVVMLGVFTALALYLCPCSFAEPVSGLQIAKAQMHDCCEGMSECPLRNQNTPGMKSFLDSFSHDSRTGQAYDFDLTQLQISPQLLFPALDMLQPPIDLVRRLEDSAFKTNPPELFIQFESLLI